MAKKPTKYQEEIENAARDFSRDVSWLAGIHVALKSGQKDVIPIATALLVNPERTLGINNYPPNIARIEFENKVALLKRLCSFATALPFNNPGHYLNMSAILHIDALLQGYLDRLFKVACTYKRLHSLPLSAFPSKKKGKEKQADQRSQQGQQKASIRKSEMKAQSVGGKINELFGRLGPKELAGTSIKHWTCTDPLWDTSIWTDLGSFLAAYKPPDSKTSHQGSLAIDTVILPYIGHAVDFIQEVANAFRAV
jgi:hypothetical protein